MDGESGLYRPGSQESEGLKRIAALSTICLVRVRMQCNAIAIAIGARKRMDMPTG